jgi:hypothetical protein
MEEKLFHPRTRNFKSIFVVAHWKNGHIDEENLFYDQMGMMR